MPNDDLSREYCRRMGKYVHFDTMEDSGRVFIICKYYNSALCILNPDRNRSCLVKLAIQKEEKNRLSSQISK